MAAPTAPTYYKNHAVPRGRGCLVCQTRTRGRVVDLHLGHGIYVRVCDAHASTAFIESRSGRDFLCTIGAALTAAGAMTRRASRALDRFVEVHGRRTAPPPGARTRPGSYAWPALRRRLEELLRTRMLSGAQMRRLVEDWTRSERRRGLVELPSLRTLRRWRAERRWAHREPTAPDATPLPG